jgi:hypothetical protein
MINLKSFFEPDLKLLAALGLGVVINPGVQSQPHPSQRPNIIYIMSDDHAYQAISDYGGPLRDLAPTPNIDRIAREGVRFDRCLVTNSISGPCCHPYRQIQPFKRFCGQ